MDAYNEIADSFSLDEKKAAVVRILVGTPLLGQNPY